MLPGGSLGLPKSIQNRSQDHPEGPKSLQGHSRASPAHSGSVLGACWDHPRRAVGAPGGSPRSLKVAPERQNGRPGLSRSVPGPLNFTKIDAKFRPGAKKTRLFRATSSKIFFAAMFQQFLSVFSLFVKCLNLQKYCACMQKQRFGPSQSKSSSLRNAASENKKNEAKSNPKSQKIVSRATWAPLLVDFCCSERPGTAT